MTTTYLFSNNATTTLASNISSTTTVINLSQGTGDLFPSPNTDEQFAVTLVDAQTGLNNEICYCTSRSGDALTVIRGQENTTATNWSAGDTAANYITAGTIESWLQQSDLQPYSDSITKAIIASGQTLNLSDTTQLTSAIKVLGNVPVWSSTVSSLIGGYPNRFVVQDASTTGAFWVSTAANNTTTPGASGASWQSLFTNILPSQQWAQRSFIPSSGWSVSNTATFKATGSGCLMLCIASANIGGGGVQPVGCSLSISIDGTQVAADNTIESMSLSRAINLSAGTHTIIANYSTGSSSSTSWSSVGLSSSMLFMPLP